MKEIGTFNFEDVETGDEACIIVRSSDGKVSICLSLEHGADVEVTMNKDTMLRVLEALNGAVR